MASTADPSETNSEDRKERRIGTVSSAFAILRLLAHARIPLGITAIAQYLHLTPSSAFNIAKTMVAESWLVFDDAEKTYQLGPGIVDVMRQALDPERAFDQIRSRVEPIANSWKITVGAWRVQGERLIASGSVFCSTSIHIRINMGHRLPLLSGATGRCVAAFSDIPSAHLSKLFKDVRWERPVTWEAFLEEVADVRTRGWAIDAGHLVRGATTLSVPIFDDLGHVRGGLVGTMFSGQHADETLPALAAELQAAATWAATRLAPAG